MRFSKRLMLLTCCLGRLKCRCAQLAATASTTPKKASQTCSDPATAKGYMASAGLPLECKKNGGKPA